MSIFEREEKSYTNQTLKSRMMQTNWDAGSFWFFEALESTKGLYNIFHNNIQSRFSNDFPYEELSRYWRPGTDKIIQSKLSDRKMYLQHLIQRAMAHKAP